jgi:hypothetical protein
MLIFRSSNCIVTAPGIVTLRKQPFGAPVESGLQSDFTVVFSSCSRVTQVCYFMVHERNILKFLLLPCNLSPFDTLFTVFLQSFPFVCVILIWALRVYSIVSQLGFREKFCNQYINILKYHEQFHYPSKHRWECVQQLVILE